MTQGFSAVSGPKISVAVTVGLAVGRDGGDEVGLLRVIIR